MTLDTLTRTSEFSPYRALWSAVLISAIKQMDSYSEADRKEASRYVFNTKDSPTSFRWICTMLNMDPEVLQNACMTRENRMALVHRKFMR